HLLSPSSLLMHSRLTSTPFFFNDTATTEIYTLSLHDALPIYPVRRYGGWLLRVERCLQNPGVCAGSVPQRLKPGDSAAGTGAAAVSGTGAGSERRRQPAALRRAGCHSGPLYRTGYECRRHYRGRLWLRGVVACYTAV